MNHNILFLFVGLSTGLTGTLIGAGGGFLLVPIFLYLFPELAPTKIVALSLLAVSANAVSGSVAYAYTKQIHWPSAFIFSLAAIPGVFFGVFFSHLISRQLFEIVFSAVMFFLAVFTLKKSFKKKLYPIHTSHFWTTKTEIIGSIISFFVGIASSLLGIGGGIIHVPILAEFLLYPVHIATGTSHAILALTSLFAVTKHWYSGDYNNLFSFVPYLILGLIIGAQFGATFSKKISSRWILRILGFALLFVAIRLISKNVSFIWY